MLYEAEIVAHMAKLFGPVNNLSLQDTGVEGQQIRLKIHVVPPTEENRRLVLFTTGMSEYPLTIPRGSQNDDEDFRFAELMLWLPPDWELPMEVSSAPDAYWPLDWMRRLAMYPHQHKTWLGRRYEVFSTTRPLAPGVPQTGWFLVANSTHGPISVENGNRVNVYWITAIHPSETEILDRFSLCIKLMGTNGFTTNPQRPAVTIKRREPSEPGSVAEFIGSFLDSFFDDEHPVLPQSRVLPIETCRWLP